MPSISLPVAVVGAAAIGTAGVLASTLLAPKPPSAPAAPPPPAASPVLDQNAINAATARQTALSAATSGRQSTVLSQAAGSSGSDKLGG